MHNVWIDFYNGGQDVSDCLSSRARPFTDSCPPGRKGLVTRAHTFGDSQFMENCTSACIACRGCVFFLQFLNLFMHKLNVCTYMTL